MFFWSRKTYLAYRHPAKHENHTNIKSHDPILSKTLVWQSRDLEIQVPGEGRTEEPRNTWAKARGGRARGKVWAPSFLVPRVSQQGAENRWGGCAVLSEACISLDTWHSLLWILQHLCQMDVQIQGPFSHSEFPILYGRKSKISLFSFSCLPSHCGKMIKWWHQESINLTQPQLWCTLAQ